MKPKRIQSKHDVPREAWLELNMPPEAIHENLKQRLIENLVRELYNSVDIVKESNGWVGEEWRVDITVMSTDEYNNLMRQFVIFFQNFSTWNSNGKLHQVSTTHVCLGTSVRLTFCINFEFFLSNSREYKT